MLSFGQFLLKVIFVFLVVILCFFNVKSVDLGLSPINLYFEGEAGDLLCQNISIFSEGYDGTLFLKDKWRSSERSKGVGLEAYNLSGEDAGIEGYYSSKILAKNQKLNICFKGRKKGFYEGLLLLSSDRGVFGVASKIKLNITTSSSNLVEKKSNFLTGLVSFEKENSNRSVLMILSLQSFVLLIGLFLLIRRIY